MVSGFSSAKARCEVLCPFVSDLRGRHFEAGIREAGQELLLPAHQPEEVLEAVQFLADA
jgi:hypothetical protein